jgi:hypothetical protein
MTEIVIVDFDVDELTAPALLVLKAAVKYAQMQGAIQLHSIPIDLFCKYAALPNLNFDELHVLLRQARKAVAVIEIVDSVALGGEELYYASWPVFDELGLKDSFVLFEVCPKTINELVLSSLWSLSVNMS